MLLSMGVNDTTALTPATHRFRQQLLGLHQRLMPESHGPMYLICVPPMHRFTAPCQRRCDGSWAGAPDNWTECTPSLPGKTPRDFQHLTYPAVADPDMLARDGYHPGVKGYAYIGEVLGEALVDRLKAS